jgi:hypothetical protein
MIGGIKVQKAQRTKFRKNSDRNDYNVGGSKQKHHDRSFYRLAKEEDYEYASAEYSKTDKRN